MIFLKFYPAFFVYYFLLVDYYGFFLTGTVSFSKYNISVHCCCSEDGRGSDRSEASNRGSHGNVSAAQQAAFRRNMADRQQQVCDSCCLNLVLPCVHWSYFLLLVLLLPLL